MKNTKKKFGAKTVTFVGMLGALSTVLMLISFPLPIAPSFLEFDIAEVPALFAGFFMGPAAGFSVILVKILLNLVINGTKTAFVGELSNLVGSTIFVVTAALIYKRDRTKKGALWAMAISTVTVSIAYVFIDALVMFPLYSKLYGIPLEAIIAMGTAIDPKIKSMTTMMLLSVFPFNLVKFGATCLITFLLYKKVGKVLRGMFFTQGEY